MEETRGFDTRSKSIWILEKCRNSKFPPLPLKIAFCIALKQHTLIFISFSLSFVNRAAFRFNESSEFRVRLYGAQSAESRGKIWSLCLRGFKLPSLSGRAVSKCPGKSFQIAVDIQQPALPAGGKKKRIDC